jgi:ParB-like chromosome segregation protein Spo0J
MVSDANNIAVVQLVENVQREDLSPIDLFHALSALREQSMTHKQIADVMGKSLQYIDNLFTGINEISKTPKLLEHITTAGGSIQDVTETKGIPEEQKRIELLEQRRNGTITRAEMRKKAKELKNVNTANNSKPAVIIQGDKPKICKLSLNRDILQITLDFEDIDTFHLIEKDIEGFLVGCRIKCE